MLTTWNCRLLEDTANFIETDVGGVVYLAMASIQKTVSTDEVQTVMEKLKRGGPIPKWLENFCIDILTCRIAILLKGE